MVRYASLVEEEGDEDMLEHRDGLELPVRIQHRKI
jgi:hypothetical protein